MAYDKDAVIDAITRLSNALGFEVVDDRGKTDGLTPLNQTKVVLSDEFVDPDIGRWLDVNATTSVGFALASAAAEAVGFEPGVEKRYDVFASLQRQASYVSRVAVFEKGDDGEELDSAPLIAMVDEYTAALSAAIPNPTALGGEELAEKVASIIKARPFHIEHEKQWRASKASEVLEHLKSSIVTKAEMPEVLAIIATKLGVGDETVEAIGVQKREQREKIMALSQGPSGVHNRDAFGILADLSKIAPETLNILQKNNIRGTNVVVLYREVSQSDYNDMVDLLQEHPESTVRQINGNPLKDGDVGPDVGKSGGRGKS